MTDFSSGFFGNKSIGFGKGSAIQIQQALAIEVLGGQELNEYSVLKRIDTDWLGKTEMIGPFEPENYSELTDWKNKNEFPNGIGKGYLLEFKRGFLFTKNLDPVLIINFSKYMIPGGHIAPVQSIEKIKIDEDENQNPIYERIYVISTL